MVGKKMSELAPCPTCGSTKLFSLPYHIQLDPNGDHFVGGFVLCYRCGLKIERSTQAEAEAAWNTRPLESALRAAIAKLEAENAAMKEAATIRALQYILLESNVSDDLSRMDYRLRLSNIWKRCDEVLSKLPPPLEDKGGEK